MAVSSGRSGPPGRGAGTQGDRAERDRTRLFERACAGDREALHQVVAELTPLLWHVARSQGLDRDGAADAVQTTWASLLSQLAAIQSPRALVGWLVTTTRRNAWKVRTDQRRETSADPADLAEVSAGRGRTAGDPGPEAVVLDRDRADRLWRYVQQLPPRCQHLLRVLAFAERPDYASVSEALDMPRGSIGPTRGRCLAKLRALMAADPSWSDDDRT